MQSLVEEAVGNLLEQRRTGGINGVDLTADADEVWRLLAGLYEAHNFKFYELGAWLRLYAQPVA